VTLQVDPQALRAFAASVSGAADDYEITEADFVAALTAMNLPE
jgi:hypothetical protein